MRLPTVAGTINVVETLPAVTSSSNSNHAGRGDSSSDGIGVGVIVGIAVAVAAVLAVLAYILLRSFAPDALAGLKEKLCCCCSSGCGGNPAPVRGRRTSSSNTRAGGISGSRTNRSSVRKPGRPSSSSLMSLGSSRRGSSKSKEGSIRVGGGAQGDPFGVPIAEGLAPDNGFGAGEEDVMFRGPGSRRGLRPLPKPPGQEVDYMVGTGDGSTCQYR